MSNDTLDQHPWSILPWHSIDISIDTQYRINILVDSGSRVDSFLIDMWVIPHGWLLTSCWSSVDWVSIKMWIKCWPSVDWVSVRVSIKCWLRCCSRINCRSIKGIDQHSSACAFNTHPIPVHFVIKLPTLVIPTQRSQQQWYFLSLFFKHEHESECCGQTWLSAKLNQLISVSGKNLAVEELMIT